MNVEKMYGKGAEVIWKDRKRFMGMPLSFTRYMLVKNEGKWMKLIVDIGLLYSVIDEVNVYRICDVVLHQSLFGKLFGTGTVTIYSSDESRPTVVLKNIKEPFKVRDMFSNLMEEQRKLNNVRMSEFHRHDA